MWATPNDSVADLRDFLDAQYGVNAWQFRDQPHNGSDCVAAMHAALDALRSRYGYGTVRVTGGNGAGGAGMFRFASPLSSEKLKGMFIVGDHPNNARLCFDIDGGVALQYTGAGGYTSGGLRNCSIFLEDGHPSSLAYCIQAIGNATYQPDDLVIENVDVKTLGNSYWYAGAMFWGNERASPQGIRVTDIRNLQVFSCQAYAIYFSNMVQMVADNLGSYTGKDYGNDIYLLGGSTGCDIRRMACNGDFYISDCHRVGIDGSAARIITDPSANYCWGHFQAQLLGTFGHQSDVVIL